MRDAQLEGVHLTPEPRRFYPGRGLAGPVLGFAGIDGRGLDGIELTMNERLSGRRVSAAALRDASGALMMPDGAVVPDAGRVGDADHRSLRAVHRRARAGGRDREEPGARRRHRRARCADRRRAGHGQLADLRSEPAGGRARPRGAQPRDHRRVRDRLDDEGVQRGRGARGRHGRARHRVRRRRRADEGRAQADPRHLPRPGADRRRHHQALVQRRRGEDRAAAGPRPAARRRWSASASAQKTGIELPGEERGLLRDAKRWGAIELATVSFGMGMSVTPLQVAAGFAAIANGGVYRAPRIVREVRDARGQVLRGRGGRAPG